MQSVAERLECLPESRIEVRDGVGLVVSKPEHVDAKGVTPRGGTQEECVVGLGDVELEGEGPGRGVGALRRAVRIEASPEPRDRFLQPPIAGCELNVAIRTVEFGADASAVLGVGGGITADSDPDREWDECLDKAAPIIGIADSARRGSRPAVPAR